MYVLTEKTLNIKVNTAYSSDAHANDALCTARSKFLKRIQIYGVWSNRMPMSKDTFYNKPDTYLCRHPCLLNARLQSQPMAKPTNTQSDYIPHQSGTTIFLPKEVEGFSLLISKHRRNPCSTSLFHTSCFITLRKTYRLIRQFLKNACIWTHVCRRAYTDCFDYSNHLRSFTV
jgi:hypothetical protein